MGRGHPINEGDKPKLNGNETYFRHGLGCMYKGEWRDCFVDCPFIDDCHAKPENFSTKNTVIARG